MIDINKFIWIALPIFLVAFYTSLSIKDFFEERVKNGKAVIKQKKDRYKNKKLQIAVLTIAICIVSSGLFCVGEAIADEIEKGKEEDSRDIIEFYIINASSITFTYDEINALSDEELFYIRNGIYALHGKFFLEEELNNFYSKFDWYFPESYTSSFVKTLITSKEWELIAIIQEIEEQRKVTN